MQKVLLIHDKTDIFSFDCDKDFIDEPIQTRTAILVVRCMCLHTCNHYEVNSCMVEIFRCHILNAIAGHIDNRKQQTGKKITLRFIYKCIYRVV